MLGGSRRGDGVPPDFAFALKFHFSDFIFW
jgi:hypothetical protein